MGSSTFTTLALSLVLAIALPAAPHWDIQYFHQQPDTVLTLNDLAFPSAERGVACGFTADRRGNTKSLVLVTSDGGLHWSEVPVRETGVALFFLDDSTGWMATTGGCGLRTICTICRQD